MRLKYIIWDNAFVVFVFLVLLFGIQNGFAQDTQTKQDDSKKSDKYLIDAENFKNSVEKKNGIVLLDVRTPSEFNDSHIKGSINVDYKNDNFRDEISKLDKNNKYYVYCRSGKRSANSRRIMNELGFKKVYDLQGGILAWKEQDYPIEEDQ